MKKIFLSMLLLASAGLHSQELDEAYLASLPEGVRDDVLQKMTDREELDKPVYRRPSLMIGKNYCTDTYTADCIPKSDRYGSNFFDMMQSSFMPINEPNFDSSYILDFGDTLEIQLIGQKNSIRNGKYAEIGINEKKEKIMEISPFVKLKCGPPAIVC